MGKKRNYSSFSESSSNNFSNSCNSTSSTSKSKTNTQDFRSPEFSENCEEKKFKSSTESPNYSSNSNCLVENLTETMEVFDSSQKSVLDEKNAKFHHSSPNESFLDETFFGSDIIKEHFSNFTKELVGETFSDDLSSEEQDFVCSNKNSNEVTRSLNNCFDKLRESEEVHSEANSKKSSKAVLGGYNNTLSIDKYFKIQKGSFSNQKLNNNKKIEEVKSTTQSNIFMLNNTISKSKENPQNIFENIQENEDSDNSEILLETIISELDDSLLNVDLNQDVSSTNLNDSQINIVKKVNVSKPGNQSKVKEINQNFLDNSDDSEILLENLISELDDSLLNFDLNQDVSSRNLATSSVISDFPINLVENLSVSFRSSSRAKSEGNFSTGSAENFDDADKKLREGLNRISKDSSLVYTGPSVTGNVEHNEKREFAKTKLEELLYCCTENLARKTPLVFKVRDSSRWDNCVFENNILKLKPIQEARITEIKFNSRGSRIKFNIIFYLLVRNYVLLLNNSTCTQREIFYQIKNFLDSQDKIRVAMNIISSMLNIEPWYLPIVSSSKGLVFGDLTITFSDNEIIKCNSFGGTLIPQDVTKIVELKSKAFFILIVEKDALFKKLLDEDMPNKLTRPFILVTGKGYPDLNTRFFARKLWMSLKIPIFILVDADPHGIEIMLTYRFGSRNMAHVSEHLAIPNLKWLGILPHEIRDLNIKNEPLVKKERDKIADMIKRPYGNENSWLINQLEILQKNGVKAEIEGLIKSRSYLTDFYLPRLLEIKLISSNIRRNT